MANQECQNVIAGRPKFSKRPAHKRVRAHLRAHLRESGSAPHDGASLDLSSAMDGKPKSIPKKREDYPIQKIYQSAVPARL